MRSLALIFLLENRELKFIPFFSTAKPAGFVSIAMAPDLRLIDCSDFTNGPCAA
jgi:hypothetical protein